MTIAELPDKKIDFYDEEVLKDEPLLEYVWEVALEFVPDPSDISSLAPNIFNKRYAISKLSGEERTARIFDGELFWLEGKSKEEFATTYKDLETSFKDIYLNNEQLQNTIEAFGLDKSKFWYLLLFIYDYVEDMANNSTIGASTTLEELNRVAPLFMEASEIVFKKNDRQSGKTNRDDVLSILKAAIKHYTDSYNNIINNENTPLEEKLEQLKTLYLDAPINDRITYNPEDAKPIKWDISYRKCYFTKMFLFFLKDRKAKTLPHIKDKVSKDKMIFISRLLYTVGYAGEDYNEEYDENWNKNRKLSNLLRRYGDIKFPRISFKRIYKD